MVKLSKLFWDFHARSLFINLIWVKSLGNFYHSADRDLYLHGERGFKKSDCDEISFTKTADAIRGLTTQQQVFMKPPFMKKGGATQLNFFLFDG